MPYTLKTQQIAVKDPDTGVYSGVDILTEQTTEGLLTEIIATGNEVKTDVSAQMATERSDFNTYVSGKEAELDQYKSTTETNINTYVTNKNQEIATMIADADEDVSDLEDRKQDVATAVSGMLSKGVDNSLTTANVPAESKAVGDLFETIVQGKSTQPNDKWNRLWIKPSANDYEIPTMDDHNELKSALSEIGLASSNVDFSQYSQITGTMQSNNIWGSVGSSFYKSTLITDIPIKMTVTALTTKNAYFSFFNKVPTQPASPGAEIYFCSGETGRHTVTMNTSENFVVPSDCKCIVVTTTSSGNDYTPKIVGLFMTSGMIEDIQSDIDGVKGDVNDLNVAVFNSEFAKAEALAKFTTVSNTLTHVAIGRTYESAKTTSIGSTLVEIPCNGYATVRYPVFVTSQDLGSIFIDENGNVIGGYDNKTASSGSYVEINIPLNAAKFILNIASSISSMSWTVTLKHTDVNALKTKVDELDDALVVFNDENRNMCLAGIKTDILTEKIPYHRGYLFHLLQNNDNSLWYGTDFNHINKIGTVTFNPTLMRFAISPKDGRIIAVQRDTRNGIWVWDGTTETHLDSFETNPQAWLYNSGVDFINDGTDEYCVFAEYSGTVVSGNTLNVWKGKYPYTSASDWEIVLSQNQGTNITHFHMVRRDPWTNILYLTAGDASAESKWWYSTDKGATWTLLVSGTDTGWGNSLCRTINFIFTEEYIYWATDHGASDVQHHTLNRIQRDAETGVIDLTTKEQLTLLPQLYATNSLCYVESPNGLFMYDRIDIGSSAVFGEPIKMLFWDFATEELVEIASLKLTESTWGGSRGKCYINYTNGKAVMPAMGFSIDTPCIFDLVCDNPANIGTIAYDVGSKTVHTINY